MNWDALGAIAETLGAIGVIATLAYLAVQVRQNTHTIKSNDDRLRAELAQNRSSQLVEFQLAIATTPSLAAILTKIGEAESVESGIESLEPTERTQAFRYFLGVRNVLDTWTHLYAQGHIDEELYDHNIQRSIRSFYPYWEGFGLEGGRPGFVDAIKKAMESNHADT